MLIVAVKLHLNGVPGNGMSCNENKVDDRSPSIVVQSFFMKIDVWKHLIKCLSDNLSFTVIQTRFSDPFSAT